MTATAVALAAKPISSSAAASIRISLPQILENQCFAFSPRCRHLHSMFQDWAHHGICLCAHLCSDRPITIYIVQLAFVERYGHDWLSYSADNDGRVYRICWRGNGR